MATLLSKPPIPFPIAVTLSFLCVPVWIVIPVFVVRHWKDAPSPLGLLVGYVLAIPIALLLSGIGFALVFGHVLNASGSALSRWTGLVALALNTIPWFYILVAGLFQH